MSIWGVFSATFIKNAKRYNVQLFDYWLGFHVLKGACVSLSANFSIEGMGKVRRGVKSLPEKFP